MRKLRISVLLFLTGLGSLCFGQEETELGALIDRALEENYQIKILRNDELIATNNNTPGNAGFLPVVTLQGTASSSGRNTFQKRFDGTETQGDNAKSTNVNGQVGLDWTVFDGFGMFARRDQLGLLQEMGKAQTRFYIEQTITDIADLYYQLIAARMRLDNFEKTLAVSRFRYDLESKKLGFGSSNALLYNQALIDYNTDSLTVIEQQRLIKSLEININRITNAETDSPVSTGISELTPDPIVSKDAIISAAIENSRDLELVEYDQLISEITELVQKADLYPQVSLFAQYSYNRTTAEIGFAAINRSYGPQYGVTVRFNLFNGYKERRELNNAMIDTQSNSLRMEDMSREIESVILDLYYQYESLRKQLAIAEQNVTAAEKSQFIAREQYEKQAISGYDFRLTQLSVINTYNSVIQMKMNLKRIGIQLDRMTGELTNKYL